MVSSTSDKRYTDWVEWHRIPNEKNIFSNFSGVGEGGRRGRPPMRNIEKSCQGVHDPPTLEKFENIYFSFEVSSFAVHTVINSQKNSETKVYSGKR